MPRLLVFVPCEKAIVAEEDHAASLIGLLQQINLPLVAGSTVPADAFVPVRWYIFTQWYRQADDEDKTFEQRTVIEAPDGQQLVETLTPFTMHQEITRNIVNITGFPVGQAGKHNLRLFLREAGKATPWQEIDTYPLTVVHVPAQ